MPGRTSQPLGGAMPTTEDKMTAAIKIGHSFEDKTYVVWVDGDVESNLDEPASSFDSHFPYDGPIDLGYAASRREAMVAAESYATRLQQKFGGLQIVRYG